MIEVRGADLGRGNRSAPPDSRKMRAADLGYGAYGVAARDSHELRAALALSHEIREAVALSHEIRSANLVKVNLSGREVDS